MSKVLKGLVSGALALSLMSPIAMGGERNPASTPTKKATDETYSVKNVLKNSKFADITLVGSVGFVGLTVYTVVKKLGFVN